MIQCQFTATLTYCAVTQGLTKTNELAFSPRNKQVRDNLRNPVDNFESVFNFGLLGKSFGLGDNPNYSLEKYLAKPIPFYSSPRIRKDVMMH